MSVTMTIIFNCGVIALLCGIVILGTTAQMTRFRFSTSLNPSMEMSNDIIYRCLDNSMGLQPNLNALVWLNGSNLVQETTVIAISPEITGKFTFRITRALEGDYTCGIETGDEVNRVESTPQHLFPYPEDDLSLPNEIPYYAETGSMKRLECAIKPGKLVRNYFVTWRNAFSGESLISLAKGSLQLQSRTDRRYSIAQDDFSLLIDGVKPSDAGTYRCELAVGGVREHDRFDSDQWYEQTKRINLTLEVFDPPMVIDPPRPISIGLLSNTIEASGSDVTYTCTGTAADSQATSLEVLWEHKGVAVDRFPNKYNTVLMPKESVDGVTSVTAVLTILSPNISDSGIVKCITRIPPHQETGLVESVASAETTLSVLGYFNEFKPDITEEGTVFFKIVLTHPIPTENHILMEFTDVSGEQIPRNITTEEGFVNNSNILYVIETIPFDVFTVRAGLINPDRTIVGPLSHQSSVLDKNKKPLNTTEIVVLAAVVCVAMFMVLVFVAIIVLVYVINKYYTKKEKRRCASDTGQTALRLTEMKMASGRDISSPNKTLSPTDMYVESYRKVRIAKYRTDAVGDQPQDDEVPEDHVFEMLENVLGYSSLKLNEAAQLQLLQRLRKFIVNKKEKRFAIQVFKDVFRWVYGDINPDPIAGEDLELFRDFVKTTDSCVQDKNLW